MPPRPGDDGCVSGVGAGLRGPHLPRILQDEPQVSWFELLADNHLATGGALRFQAEEIAQRYPVTLHCVGMSLGGVDALDLDYLDRLRALADRTGAELVSDHLAFTSCQQWHSHDLLPIPWTDESLHHVVSRVEQAQDRLGRRILVENISAYFEYDASTLPEHDFLAQLCAETGCGLLLDINNVFVNAHNHGRDPRSDLAAFPREFVGEIHVAGHGRRGALLIDTHGAPVADPVLELYRETLSWSAGIPVLIEWDTSLPEWPTLLAEVRRLEAVREIPMERSA